MLQFLLHFLEVQRTIFPHPSFPVTLHGRFLKPIVDQHGAGFPAVQQITAAWQAIVVRFTSMMEHDRDFAETMRRYGVAPAQPHRYMQERELFEFASAATSMFDAYHYGLYALGALLHAQHFPLTTEQHERAVNFGSTRDQFAAIFPNDPIVISFDRYGRNQTRIELARLRNFLTHRLTPSRHFSLDVGSSAPPLTTLQRLNLTLDDQLTHRLATGALALMVECLEASADFVERHIVPVAPPET